MHLWPGPAVPLRRRLFVLTAAGIMPLAVITGIGLHALAREEGAQAQRVGLELARSVATAIAIIAGVGGRAR
jgi:hypothetical protein